jgi:hypothetical protein
MLSSGIWRLVALVWTDVSGERIASIIRMTGVSDLGTTVAITSNRSVLQLLVIANVVPSSMILFSLMMEVIFSSETTHLTRAIHPKSRNSSRHFCVSTFETYSYILYYIEQFISFSCTILMILCNIFITFGISLLFSSHWKKFHLNWGPLSNQQSRNACDRLEILTNGSTDNEKRNAELDKNL